jgi:hypothetical protein
MLNASCPISTAHACLLAVYSSCNIFRVQKGHLEQDNNAMVVRLEIKHWRGLQRVCIRPHRNKHIPEPRRSVGPCLRG